MLNIIRRPLALRDFKDIWRYTHQKWGEKQADKYVNKLNVALNGLAINPKKGKKSNFIHDGVYVYQVVFFISVWISHAINSNNPLSSPTTAPMKV